jgi:hypothetical protein
MAPNPINPQVASLAAVCEKSLTVREKVYNDEARRSKEVELNITVIAAEHVEHQPRAW